MKLLRFSLVTLAVILLDQASKLWVIRHFSLYETREIIPGFFHLTYLVNTGAAFSMLAGQPSLWRQLFFISVALVALVAIFFLHRKIADQSPWYTVSLAMIAGGAVGNLIDRIRLGHVTDFLDVFVGTRHWPAFNIADSAITVGVGIFLLLSFLDHEREEQG